MVKILILISAIGVIGMSISIIKENKQSEKTYGLLGNEDE
jgi:hypothetical protein